MNYTKFWNDRYSRNKTTAVMKKIVVNSAKYGEKEIFVDDADYLELIKYKWFVVKMPKTFYAVRFIYWGYKQKSIYMHRHILGLTKRNELGDHEDHDGLNNQRSNIRISNHLNNQHNKAPKLGSSSKFVGVHWHKRDKKWQAAIAVNGRQTHLGLFDNEIQAAVVRDNAAKKYYGESAYINIKDND